MVYVSLSSIKRQGLNKMQLTLSETSTPLCELMERHGSDKGNVSNTAWHNYTRLYYNLFKEKREQCLRVVEVGIGTTNLSIKSNMGVNGKPGASLRGWRDFFPKATVYGADIDKEILFTEDRITTYYCDQTNPSTIQAMWASIGGPVDIIIDDGLHEFVANECFFDHSWMYLNQGGVFVIEDLSNDTCCRLEEKIKSWEHSIPFDFTLVKIPHPINPHDNNLLVAVRR